MLHARRSAPAAPGLSRLFATALGALLASAPLAFALPAAIPQVAGRLGNPASAKLPPAPAAATAANPATADVSTTLGTVTTGSYLSTHDSDDVAQELREMVTGGKPSARKSLLDHVWSFDVLGGHNYQLAVEAWHTPNAESDDFRFSISRDDQDYLPVLTVTAVADDDVAQLADIAVDVSGTVFVRVEDTNGTPGGKLADSLFVDRLVILSDDSGPDVTPPSPPFDLVATPGDNLVQLDWSDWGEWDLAGCTVYRSALAGGPWTALNATPAAGGSYVDDTAANLTIYHYLVRCVDGAGNASTPTAAVMAVPRPPDAGAVLMHVSKLAVSSQSVISGWRQGRADVTVVDETGAPVAGALVTGAFSGALNQTKSATTGATGVATLLTTQTLKGSFSFTFCVTDVALPGKLYLSGENASTCATK
ncbi:MAG TPA: carboxypeptidase-like regulatory domain-containing protein [Planctomycetota bacterium]|nr:carboxypeptidase-like regulatory domain-containing protein [Planctomycetota bacterium]